MIEVHDEQGKKFEDIPLTSDDQMTVSGILPSNTYASVHLRGGTYKTTNLLWEIEGTNGELQVNGSSGLLQMSFPKLYASFNDEDLKEITIDDEQSTDLNTGRAFNEFAKENGSYPTWDDAVV